MADYGGAGTCPRTKNGDNYGRKKYQKVVAMLLIKPRRKMIYGLSWTLMGAAAVCFICLFPWLPEFDHESGSVIHNFYLRIGLVDWLWVTKQTSYLATPPTITWTYQIQWFGLIGNLLLVGLVIWLFPKGWHRSVKSTVIRGSNCDSCGYDLQGSLGKRCPECGEMKIAQSISGANWQLILKHLILSVLMLCVSLCWPLFGLVILLGPSIDMVWAVMMLFFLPVSLAWVWIWAGQPWVLAGQVTFNGKRDTPRNRRKMCLWMAWLPALGILAWLACEMSFYFYNAPLYYDAEFAESVLMWWLPATVVYGSLMHVILARRLRKSFRRSGVCFECARKLVEGEEVICAECQSGQPQPLNPVG